MNTATKNEIKIGSAVVFSDRKRAQIVTALFDGGFFVGGTEYAGVGGAEFVRVTGHMPKTVKVIEVSE